MVDPEVKSPTSVGLSKKQESSRKTSASALLSTPKPLTVWITQTVENYSRDGNTRPPYLLPEKPVCRSRVTVRTRHGTTDWFKIGKGVRQGCILSLCLFNFFAEYIIQNTRLDESQAEIKIARGNTNNLRYADDTTLKAESKESLDESERGE